MDRATELEALRGWAPDTAAEREERAALVDAEYRRVGVEMDPDVSLAEASLFASARRIATATKDAETRIRSLSPSMRQVQPNAAFKVGPRSPEFRSAWISRLRTNSLSDAQRDALAYGEVRDLTHGTGASGAYTVPQDFGDAVAQSVSWNGAMRSVAKILETPGSSRTMPLPTTDSSSAGAATILTENTAPNEATDPVFAAVTLHGYPFVAPAVLYPFSLVQDTAYTPMPDGMGTFEKAPVNRPGRVGGIDLVALLASIGGERLALGQEPFFATGTGTGQPQGAFTATANVTTASPTAITWVELVALYTSLNAAYRNSATWMFSTATFKLLNDLEDSAGKPLFNPAFGPMQILGRPVVINDQAPAPTAALKPIVFADFSRYYVIRSGGVLSIPLVERFAEAMLGALIIAEFADGAIYDSKAGVVLQMHA